MARVVAVARAKESVRWRNMETSRENGGSNRVRLSTYLSVPAAASRA
jgi:hypothetical protein